PARFVPPRLWERLAQPFVVDTRPGGGTNIGPEMVVRAPADGYTLLVVGPPAAINATLYEKLSFNFLHDIAPVAAVFRVPHVIVVHRLFRQRPLRSSSPTPKTIRARSTWHPPAPAPRPIWPASCSRRWPTPTWCTSPTGAGGLPSSTCGAEGSKSFLPAGPGRSRRCGPASCPRWQ